MRPTTPAYAAAITLYLAAGGAAQVLWLDVVGTLLDPTAAGLCALPTLLAALMALGSRADAPHYRARLLAAGALLPLMLLLWSQTRTTALPPVVTGLHALLVLACHAAAVTVTMDRLDLRWPRPFGGLVDRLPEPAPRPAQGGAHATLPRRVPPTRRQFSWVTSLVFR